VDERRVRGERGEREGRGREEGGKREGRRRGRGEGGKRRKKKEGGEEEERGEEEGGETLICLNNSNSMTDKCLATVLGLYSNISRSGFKLFFRRS
jgi:hypothetical protein